MILKTNDTKVCNITMELSVYWDTENISIHISHWDKRNGTVSGYDYPAEEFAAACRKFEELENLYK